ncbi:MAG TPA: trypsin-like peptidase domain-containing protein [Anaerolineales bacterium]|nr:trypsin-like peptidase domain-containing protein [Anaerolineales bacterium]
MKARRALPFLGGILAVIFGALIYRALFPQLTPLAEADIDERIVQAMASATPPPAFSAQVYNFIIPSIVYIQTDADSSSAEGGGSIGSGVVINEDGDVLTALHVVEGADEIEIFFADGSHSIAELLNDDPENDIAVLRPQQLPDLIVPAILGNPNALRVGDEAFTVGNPLGLAGSMSSGVISGFDRSIPLDEEGRRLEGLIQFDAAVNPGSSGGPLLNRFGQVIGIVTALANPSEQNFFTGIGFAVPISVAGGAAGAPEY